jgi:hypothetical protein
MERLEKRLKGDAFSRFSALGRFLQKALNSKPAWIGEIL